MVPFMIRISRMTDYATVLLAALAREPEACLSAPALAERTRIGMPTVSKVLKILQRGGLVRSTRGLHGGYSLARPAQAISAAAILDALEGHGVAVAAHRMDGPDDVVGPHLRTRLSGSGEVVEVEGVLGADPAADIAVAAVDAGSLGLALRVSSELDRARRQMHLARPDVPVGLEPPVAAALAGALAKAKETALMRVEPVWRGGA